MSSQGWRSYPYARIAQWHDGDTCSVEIDHGFGVSQKISVRVYGVSAPEVTGKERDDGMLALEFVSKRFTGHLVNLWTWKKSFDRYVGLMVTRGDGIDIAAEILGSRLARAWDGVTARPSWTHDNNGDMVIVADDELKRYASILARDFKP